MVQGTDGFRRIRVAALLALSLAMSGCGPLLRGSGTHPDTATTPAPDPIETAASADVRAYYEIGRAHV